jgi:hypothetical protein
MLTTAQAIERMLSPTEQAETDLAKREQIRKRVRKRLIASLERGKIEGATSVEGRVWLIPEDGFDKYLATPRRRGRPVTTGAGLKRKPKPPPDSQTGAA